MKSRGVFVVSHALDLKPNAVNIDEAMDIAGHGRYNYFLILACSIIRLGAFIDILGFSIVVPAARCDLQLSLEQSAMLTSIPFAGFLFALPFGYLADTRGRRTVILILSMVSFIISVMNSFSSNFLIMLILKFIGGSCSIGSLTLTIVYTGECVKNKHRSNAMLILNCFDFVSDLVSFGLAYIFLPLDFNLPLWSTFTYKSWRLLYLTLATPLALGAFILVFLHESPKFLANKGELDKALEVLKSIYKMNGGNDDSFPVTSLIGNSREEENESFWETISRQIVLIFKPPMLWKTMQLFYLITVCYATNNVFFMWFPAMVNSFYNNDVHGGKKTFCQRIIANISVTMNENEQCNDRTPVNTIYVGILFSLFFVILNLTVMKLSPRRKLLLLTTFMISGFGAGALNLFENQIVNMILFLLIQITGICGGTIGSYFVDTYPTSYRGFATSLGIMLARFACFGAVNLIGALVVNHCQLTFYSYAIFILSGGVAALFVPSVEK